MPARWRGRFQLHRFLLGRRWAYVASAVGLLIGIATAVLAPPVGVAGIGIAATSTLIAIATFVRDSQEIARQGARMHIVDRGSRAIEGLEPSDRYRSFEFADFDGEQVMFSDELNALLAHSRSPLTAVADPYRLSGHEHECATLVLKEHFRRGAVLFNDQKVRLVTDLTPAAVRSSQAITIQRTDYFSSLCTNEIAKQEIRLKGSNHPVLRGRDLFSSNDVLSDLEISRCSNHIGVSTIAVSRDGHLILATQASGSAQSPNRVTASGSGSVDWADYRRLDVGEFEHLLRHAMERELAEEIGINASAVMATVLIGYARILGRGGKPEFFGMSVIDAKATDFGIRRKERLFVADIAALRLDRSSPRDVEVALSELERERGGAFALSLTLALEFMRRRLRSDPNGIIHLIRGDMHRLESAG